MHNDKPGSDRFRPVIHLSGVLLLSQLILILLRYRLRVHFVTVPAYGPSGSVLLYLPDPSLDPDLGSRAASQSHVLFMNTHHCNTENITFVSVAAKLRFP